MEEEKQAFKGEKVKIDENDYKCTDENNLQDSSVTNKNSTFYRILKTILLGCIWMSHGINTDLFGPALEDFRILLNVDYEHIAGLLISRTTGSIIGTVASGLILDRILHHSNIVLIFAKIVFVIPSFIIPNIRTYWLTATLFLIQGTAIAVLEVCGSELVLRLWHGISNSPISAVFAGQSIGSIISVFIVMKFVKFNPNSNLLKNNQTTTVNISKDELLKPDDINLQIPYSIAGSFGLFVAVCFICLQFIEVKTKHAKLATVDQKKAKLLETNYRTEVEAGFIIKFLNKFIFNTKLKSKKIFYIKIIQVFLLTILSMNLSSFVSVCYSYMVTYLTKGPAKIPLDTFFILQSLYWLFFVISRLTTAYVAFKINNSLFVIILLISNLIFSILYTIPALNSCKLFYYFIIILLAITSAPFIPTGFMITKHTLFRVNAVIISIVSIGMSIGFISGQYMTGYLLDKLVLPVDWFGYKDVTSVYIIPYLLLFYAFISCPIYFVIFFIYLRHGHAYSPDT